MPNRLLDRQVRLVEHLTSGVGIFGASRGISKDRALHGLDLGLLHVEARFSHEKRMQKIEWVLTRTLELLGSRRDAMIRDFVEACPPQGIGWLENARQFHDFLTVRWQREAPEPPYLPDVASCELAYATVRAGQSDETAALECASEAPHGAIRRHPSVVLLRCAHDIRPILEGRVSESDLARRETLLAVAMLPGTDDPLVFELSSELFELLEMLDRFTDPVIFRDTPGLDKLIADLAAHGLVEVHQ
jgi:hypothetical protein